MKRTLQFVLVITPVLLQAQAHFAVNWALCPKNPVPFSYTSNHYGYAGRVKTVTEEWGSMRIERSFDETGVQQSGVSKILGNEITTFQYKPEQLQLVKIQAEGSSSSTFIQTFNNMRQVIRSENGPAQQYVFLYNSSGLLEEKKFSPGNTVTKYIYNEAGQLVQEEMYRDTVLAIVYTYQYKTAGNQLEVTCRTRYKASGSSNSHKEVYNAAGMLVKEITSEEERIYSYRLDAAGNWTEKKTTYKSLSSASVIVKEAKRTIVYW